MYGMDFGLRLCLSAHCMTIYGCIVNAIVCYDGIMLDFVFNLALPLCFIMHCKIIYGCMEKKKKKRKPYVMIWHIICHYACGLLG